MRIQHFVAAGAFVVAASTTASAQIGGLVRRAKDAAVTKAVESKVESKVSENKKLRPSTAFGPELTEASLDGVIRGLAASLAKLDEADQTRLERQRVDAEAAKSYTAHEKDRQNYDNLVRKIEPCQDSVRQTRKQAAQDAYAQRMQNPAAQAQMIQETLALAKKNAELQAKGDTAGVRRLVMDMAKAQGIDPKADSAAAIKTCGAVPTRPVWLDEQDSLRARSARLDNHVRDIESNAQSAGAAASGMSGKDYGLARERVLHWSHEARGGTPIQAFGTDERKLMEARRSEIEKYKKALN